MKQYRQEQKAAAPKEKLDRLDPRDFKVLERAFENYQLWRELIASGKASEELTLPSGIAVNFWDIGRYVDALPRRQKQAVVHLCFHDSSQQDMAVEFNLVAPSGSTSLVSTYKRLGLTKVLTRIVQDEHAPEPRPTKKRKSKTPKPIVAPEFVEPSMHKPNTVNQVKCVESDCINDRGGRNSWCWMHVKRRQRQNATARAWFMVHVDDIDENFDSTSGPDEVSFEASE